MKKNRKAVEVVRVFRVVLKLEDKLQAAHAAGDWAKAWEVAVRLRRAIKSSRGLVDRFADTFGE